MKKLLTIFPALLALTLMTASCDKLSSDDSDADRLIITDTKLIGIWNVVKYEALDKNGDLMYTEASTSVIAEGYYKFVFDSECNMLCYSNQSSGWYGSTTYAYFSSSMDLLFGSTGEARVSTLSDTFLVFESDSFAPLAWYDSATGLLKSDISTVRVTCMKVPEQ